MQYSYLLVNEYEMQFGKGSWSQLEGDVRSRHPEFFAMYDAAQEEEPEPQRKWWQFWK